MNISGEPIDLTLEMYEGMKHRFSHREIFKIAEVHSDFSGPLNCRDCSAFMFLHAGTHVDAPYHFIETGKKINEVPLNTLMGPAAVLDLRHIKEDTPITPADLDGAVEKLAEKGITTDNRILLCTGHLERTWGSWDYWDKSPYLSHDAARWLVNRKIALAGFDFHPDQTPGRRKETVSQVQKIIFGSGMVDIKCVNNLEKIVGQQVYLFAAALRIAGAEASPARVVAFPAGAQARR